MSDSLQWRVLLISGASGVGKTELARVLRQQYGVSLLLADDIRLALQRVTTPQQVPRLHYFFTTSQVWQQPTADIVAGWYGVGAVVSEALKSIIGHHTVVPDAGTVIIEGDGILPSVLSPTMLADETGIDATWVRSLHLHEPDAAARLTNLRSRERGFNDMPRTQQERFAEAATMFDVRLADDARAQAVPVVEARPYATLLSQARHLLDG